MPSITEPKLSRVFPVTDLFALPDCFHISHEFGFTDPGKKMNNRTVPREAGKSRFVLTTGYVYVLFNHIVVSLTQG